MRRYCDFNIGMSLTSPYEVRGELVGTSVDFAGAVGGVGKVILMLFWLLNIGTDGGTEGAEAGGWRYSRASNNGNQHRGKNAD